MPAFVGLADSWKADVWGAGHMGRDFEPVKGLDIAGRLAMPEGLSLARLQDRHALRQGLDNLARAVDRESALADHDRFQQAAYDMVLSGKVQEAFDVSREPDAVRDPYGRVSVGEKALLARRLVEAGVTFVLVSGALGLLRPPRRRRAAWGGIEKGLTPMLPTIDRALVRPGEGPGRSRPARLDADPDDGRVRPLAGDDADAGRDHWTNVMSMLVAGGGLPAARSSAARTTRATASAAAASRPRTWPPRCSATWASRWTPTG